MDYRQRFFARYVSTHTAHRDGTASLAQFQQRAVYFKQRWHGFFPQDRHARILDVGCGNGSLIWWLQSCGYQQAGGIDVSAEQVAEARRLGVANVAQADVHAFLSGCKSSYEVLVMRDVLEHFPKVEVLELLDLCFQALAPQGRLIVQVPNAESPFFGRIRYGDFTHELAFSATSLQQLFAVAGFGLVALYPTDPAIISPRSALRYPLWRVVSAFYQLLLFAELGPGRRIVTQGIIAVATKSPLPREHNG